MNRRTFIKSAVFASIAASVHAAGERAPRLLLRSSWQTVNIGDIAHTPGMLTLLEKHRPAAKVTLWPSSVDRGVEELLRARFPKLRIAKSEAERETALAECDFFLHGSGPGLVGGKEAKLAQQAGKPYGFGGITLNDGEIQDQRELLAGAKFVFLRDTDSLRALQASGITGPRMDFGPDASFAVDLRDEVAAAEVLKEHLLRQPTDTRKGRMWYDLRMNDWVFEIDDTTGAQIAARLVQIGRDLPAARAAAAKARAYSRERMAAMMAAIPGRTP